MSETPQLALAQVLQPAPRFKNTITASSLATLFSCQRRFYLAHEVGWKKPETSDALRFGSAFHAALEARAKGADFPDAMCAAVATAEGDELDAATVATLEGLVAGYYARYNPAEGRDEVSEMHPEITFAIKHPAARGFTLRGKIDGLCVFRNGQTGIIEHKTTSEDIAVGALYWDTINRDQIALYGIAAERNGWPVDVYLYDVIRKPTIKIKQDETADDFAKRLKADAIGAEETGTTKDGKPKVVKRGEDFYYQRREIAVLADDKARLERRLKVATRLIKGNRKQGAQFAAAGIYEGEAWGKCGSVLVCRSCPYRGICDSEELPKDAGWERGHLFEELAEKNGANK